MYHEVGIQALSPKQISRLLNAHPVRVKAGSDAKIQVTTDHAKKLAKAGMKGSALTMTLDPFAIQNNQHLRGQGPKGLKKFQKWTGAIGDFLKPVAKPIIGALTDAAVQNIEAYGDQSARMAGVGPRKGLPAKYRGTGPKGLKKFQKWTGAIGDFLKPVAKPIIGALTDAAVQNIEAYGDQSARMAGRGKRGKRGGTLLIDQPFTARQAVDTTGRFVKDPAKTLGFGFEGPLPSDKRKKPRGLGGTLLIDQPFTARQAVDTMGRFVKDPAKTIGFGKVPRMLKKDRPKRVMSEAQKAALAKGRAALRIKLNEMGAGGALRQAGYGME
jgi:cytochrome c553